jgi:hypothetical protein
MQRPRIGQCKVLPGGENPSGTSTYMLLTTGPLGADTYTASAASQCGFVMLTGGYAQKNGWEYPSCTVCPPNHASVKPMLMQLAPPSRQGSATARGSTRAPIRTRLGLPSPGTAGNAWPR